MALPAITLGEAVKYVLWIFLEKTDFKQDPISQTHHLSKQPSVATPSCVLETHQPSTLFLYGSLLTFPSQARANILCFEH